MTRRAAEYWFLYPLRGISISDPDPDLSQPLFDDATVLSIQHLKALSGDLDANRFASSVLHDVEAYHAFIAVRWYLKDPQDDEERKAAEQATLQRGMTVTAAIAFAMYLQSKTPCTLAEFHYQAGSSYLLTDRDLRLVSGSTQARGLVIGGDKSPAAMTRKDLAKLIVLPPADALTFLLRSRPASVDGSLIAAATSAARSLCLAKHVSVPSYKLLGSVTAMELLVTDEQTKYHRVEARVRSLIGPKVAEKYDISGVFKWRHDFVHKGIEPADESAAWHAESAALHCLVRFSQAVPRFKHKRELIEYLDVLAAADHFASQMSSAEADAASKLLRHSRERLRLGVLY